MRSKSRHSKRRPWKMIGAIAVTVAASVLVTVLVLSTLGAPDDGAPSRDRVLATVNGEEITEAEVYRLQIDYYWTRGKDLDDEDALEMLIVQKALNQEAELGGHKPTPTEAERRLMSELGWTAREIEQQLESEGICYEEFLESVRLAMAVDNFRAALYEEIEVTEEEARKFYEEMKEAGEELEPFEEIESLLIEFLKYEEFLAVIGEIRAEADVEYR